MDHEHYDGQEKSRAHDIAQFSLFGHERRTRMILLALALLNVGILALVAGYLFNLTWDPYSPARFLW